MNRLMAAILVLASALAGVGCGESKTVTIGEGEKPGVYKQSMNRAGDTAAAASEKIDAGNQTLSDF